MKSLFSQDYHANTDKLPDPKELLHIPRELRGRPCWVLWKLERDKGRLTKAPYRTHNPTVLAISTKEKTWSGFWDTLARYIDDREQPGSPDLIAGIGSVFNGDGYCGIDLDGCLYPDGTIDPGFVPIIEGFTGTYTEVSWSGSGLHIIIRCDNPPKDFTKKWTVNEEKREVALFSTGRYFTFSGRVYGTGATVKTYTGDEVRDILKPWITEKEPRQQQLVDAVQGPAPEFSDREIIDIATKARNGKTFTKLMAGRWKGNYPSQSEADLALASVLGFFTRDTGQITRIMQESKLSRDKWKYRPEYLQDTIVKALMGMRNTYTPVEARGLKVAAEIGKWLV